MFVRSIPHTWYRCLASSGVLSRHSNRSFSNLLANPFRRGGILISSGVGHYLSLRATMSSSSSVLSGKQVQQIDNVLAARNDDHGGVIVEMTKEPMDASVFISLLRASICHWRQQGKKGVWIKMPIELVNLIEPAVKEGFYFHHAEPKYVMLVYWIPKTINTLPANATHRVGVGAFVLNENNEVLVVREKSGKFRGTGVWKFPTGVVDEVRSSGKFFVMNIKVLWAFFSFTEPPLQGEDICDAAVREVKEETGVDAQFLEILAFRQNHKSFFEKSDLFFLCMLQPISFDIQIQELEIEAAQWMPFEEYTAQPYIQNHSLFKYIADVCSAKKEGKYPGLTLVHAESVSSRRNSLYVNKQGFSNL